MTELYEHPEYRKARPDLKRFHDMFHGDHATLVGPDYLFYHALERRKPAVATELSRIQQMRKDREERTRYLNVPDVVVSLLLSNLLRKKYILDAKAQALLKDYEDDIDGRGTSLQAFIRDDLTESLLVYGASYVLVDTFSVVAKNAAVEKELGLRPFMETLNPLQVKDWDIEQADPRRLGRYNFLRHEFEAMLPRERANQKPERALFSACLELVDGSYTIKRYKIPIGDNQEVRDATGFLSTQSWEPYGDDISTHRDELPLSVIKSESWIKDVCEETLRHFNLRSMKDSVEFAQGFQKLFVTGVDFSNPNVVSAISEFSVSGIPENSQVISIEPVSTADLRASVQEALENAFKVGLNRLRQLPADSREAQSADTQQEDKQDTMALLESTIEDIEVCINSAIKDFAKALGQEDFDGELTLDQEFTDRGVDQLVQLWQAFGDLYAGNDVVTKSMQRKILSKLDFSAEETEAGLEAIDRIGGKRQAIAENPLRQNLLSAIGGKPKPQAQT